MGFVRPLSIMPPQKANPKQYVSKGARLGGDNQIYRYSLWRAWRGTHNPKHWEWFGEDGQGKKLGRPLSVVFVMLNPSTADGEKDDPTIRKCVGFAQRWKYERLEIVNLFAYRTSSPKELFDAQRRGVDIIGPHNSEIIQNTVRDAHIIVCAWGTHAKDHEFDFHIEEVRGWLETTNKPQYALGFTANRSPRHPVRLPYNTKLERMPP